MRKIAVTNHLTLDGVMQGPATVDEDRRGGFEHGGWAAAGNDPVMAEVMGKGMAGGGELLVGRVTYENLYAFWPKQTDGNPFTEVLNKRRKYVVSRTLSEPLPWVNSTLLAGDAAESVAALKASPGEDLGILGSGELVRTLVRHGLVDTYQLMIHPLLLGTGRRMFPDDDGVFTRLRLTDSVTTTTGVIIATYVPAEG
ncbi:MAG: dihydrofolate reductase [Streptosporangiales bacterium]|nr:dihydrofolate reductase [Streptosporangiales bacterium]